MKKDFDFSITIKLNRSDVLKALKSKGANTEYLEELAMWMRGDEGQTISLDADVPEDKGYIDTLADIVSDLREIVKDEELAEDNREAEQEKDDEPSDDFFAKQIGSLEDWIGFLKDYAATRKHEKA